MTRTLQTIAFGAAPAALLLTACAGQAPPPADSPAEADAPEAGAGFADEAGDGLSSSPPPPAPMAPIEFPAHHERTLANGARVIVVENDEQPVVTIDLRFGSGGAAEPEDGVGVAGFTAELLTKGTRTRSAEEIAASIDYVGGSLGAGAGEDWISVTATALTEHLDTALVLLEDVVREPIFPEEELETHRRRTLSSLQVELSQPEAIAQRRFLREIYGEHPYGTELTPEAVRAIERDELVDFHREHLRMDEALFVVAGDVDPDEIVTRLDERFDDAGRTGAGAEDPTADAAAADEPPSVGTGRTDREIVLVHRPGSVQSVIRMGHLLEPATDPDWVALDVAMQILGGGSTGWLFDVLREEKGYTYGAYAQGVARRGPGYFQAFAEVRNEVADSALAELVGLIERIRSEPVPAEDLRLARDFIVGSFPLSIETPQQIAGQIATSRLLGRPQDWIERYRERVAAVTADDVRRVANEHLRPDSSVIVVVGDANALYDRIAPFGRVRLYDVEGAPITREEIAVSGGADDVAFDPSSLEETTLVYSLELQDDPVGEIVTTVQRDTVDGRHAFRLTTEGGGQGITLAADVVFDAGTFEPIASRNEQAIGPNRFVSDLRMEDGRIVGTISAPGQPEQDVDAEASEGTLLPGMDDVVVWLADFAAHPEISVPSFNAGSGTVQRATLEVVGEETVQVEAGEFEAWVIRAESPDQVVTVYARREAPHYVLRQQPEGQPITIELKEIR